MLGALSHTIFSNLELDTTVKAKTLSSAEASSTSFDRSGGSGTLALLGYDFDFVAKESSVLTDGGLALDSILDIDNTSVDSIDELITEEPIVYPSPLKQSEGGYLGYELGANMPIEVHIYDMLANLVYKGLFAAGGDGGKEGYNKIKIRREMFNGRTLSAGVYFFVLLSEDKVIGTTKAGFLP